MKEPGRQTDEAIDRVFTALRSAEAPAGMETRILRALEARTAAHPKNGWRNPLPARVSKPAWATYVTASLAMASLLIVVSGVLSIRRPKAAPLQPRETAVPLALSPPYRLNDLHQQPSSRLPMRATRGGEASSDPRVEPVSEEDALAISEMLAPSKPAPPLPLTHEEKLLAQVVHQGEPEELADLKPDLRARQMELSKAEFHDFFEPPAKDNE